MKITQIIVTALGMYVYSYVLGHLLLWTTGLASYNYVVAIIMW